MVRCNTLNKYSSTRSRIDCLRTMKLRFDDSNIIGCISIFGLAYRFPDDLSDLIKLVKNL